MSEALHSTSKGLSKLGKLKTGACVRLYLNNWKDLGYSSPYEMAYSS